MPTLAHYLFPILAVLFLALASRARLQGGQRAGAVRAWATVGIVFSLVSAWLWSRFS
jgi:hypothetical protein